MNNSRKKVTLVFTGSYVDGLRNAQGELMDTSKWAGFDLDDDQFDLLWENTGDIAIVESCGNAIIDEEEHDSDIPGQSDLFIEVRTHDVDALRREVAQIIKAIIEENQSRTEGQ